MTTLICDQKLREELSGFCNTIDDNVINKLKDLCVIHDIDEQTLCAQLLAFLIKGHKPLTLEVIDDFQLDYLDKKAINEYKKSKAMSEKLNRSRNSMTTKSPFNSSFKMLFNEMTTESVPVLTTKIEIAIDDNNKDDDDITIIKDNVNKEMIDLCVDSQDSVVEVFKTPEKVINRSFVNMDVSAMTTPALNIDDSINSSLKINEGIKSNTLCYFGNSYSDNEWRINTNIKHNVEVYDRSISLMEGFKFMSLKIKETNEILNDLIDEFSEQLRQKLDIESWNHFSVQSPSEAYYIGRVCYDCTQNKLNNNLIRFEGSRYLTNSESIDLDLSRLSNYSLFAGQVMACKAINESGKSLIVQEIIDFNQILEYPTLAPTFQQPVTIVVATGPFNTNQTIDFKPLKTFMDYVKKYEPDFCILLGPFVDSMNEKLLTTEERVDHIFYNQMTYISQELMDIKTEAIVIPSTRDLNMFNLFPSAAFDCFSTAKAFKSNKIHYFSNPCILNISGLIIAMTSTDVLLHLSKEEISAGQNTDRLSRLCKHIINQKSFYPIFPPNPEVNLEFTKYDFLRLPVNPHIILLPSDLREFVKNISHSVVINTGRISKNKLTRIRVDPIDAKLYNNSLEAYTNVEIIKIN
ncbi:DNA polymerase alpha subunit B-like [Oppia nitens]|uniref:DNA polymerase alpha subunit B-like n=1 Tax=Oppia nitens TaxID=1686743 RepID=UPI0023DB137E|nr:DNA polymerase alpha subunit B-like [Oppia nitens]